jgi:hypothetical protein
MATPVTDLRDQLSREINIPGFEQLPDITNTQLDSYVLDGFWECRLLGMLDSYTITDGSEFATPIGDNIQAVSDAGDLPERSTSTPRLGRWPTSSRRRRRPCGRC